MNAYPLPNFAGMIGNDASIIASQSTFKAREYYIEGYERAEQDLALTWKNIKAIVTIADSMLTNTAWDAIDWPDEQKYYEEVLRRFNEQREKI